MSADTLPPVVVGIDGTEQGLQAVRFAVAEAQRAGCALRLVHVLPELADTSPIVPLSKIEIFDEIAQRVMREAEEAARAAAGEDVRLEKVMRTGTRVHNLVEASEGARLVVLGHRARSLRERVMSSSTSTGVATRAHCPVVCIPPGWTGEHEYGRVVVGIKDPGRADELLSRAFAAASGRRAGLRVLHAWRVQRPYDEIMVGRREAASWTTSVADQLAGAIAGLEAAFPEVEVQVDVHHQHRAAALIATTQDADLLLLGRRVHSGPRGFSLGSTARALIREAHCPVEITPLQPTHDAASTDHSQPVGEYSPQP